MAARFRRTRRGIEVRFEAAEAAMLRGLLDELVELLGAEDGGSGAAEQDPLAALVGMTDPEASHPAPTDPALARLLPDAYRDDAAAAAEFRRFTESDLRAGKRAGAVAMRQEIGAGGRCSLTDEAGARWLAALNDLRLAMGARLEVTETTYDEVDALPESDPRKAALSVFAWLGWLEETLVAALARW